MNPVFRLVASLGVGVTHFVLTLFLGPNLVCANGGACIDPLTGEQSAGNIFDFPLSIAHTVLAPIFEGRSFAYYAVVNSLAFTLLVWAGLFLFGRMRARFSDPSP